jgi:uncharacterized protein (TIGR00251 family)
MEAVLDIRVIPRAAKAGVAGSRNGAIVIRLNAPPVDGAANAELIDILAAALGLPRRAVTIVAGERGRTKRVRVTGIALEAAVARLTS